MPTQFAVPKSPARHIEEIDHFRGVDLYNASPNVDTRRSPEAPNMIRDEVGSVRKRMGFLTMMRLSYRINGVHVLGDDRLVHSGTHLYRSKAVDDPHDLPHLMRAGLADRRSTSIQMGGKLYILDGLRYLVYDGNTATPVEDNAYVPIVVISRSPNGGGESLEPLNLLSKQWMEMFLGDGTTRAYRLTTTQIEAIIKVETQNSNGDWVATTAYTVNLTTGVLTFTTAPTVPPVAGVDNVRITASKTRTGYTDRINRCDVVALYGVGGSPDRLFVAGDPTYPNIDYHSQLNDPTYFGDTWYSLIGQDNTAIIGYTVLNNMLATHKTGGGDGRTVVVRSGTLAGEVAAFPIVNTLQGESAIAKRSFAHLGKEPLFVTRSGIYAITAEELTGERYSQQRGMFLSTAIQHEPSLEDSFAFVWNDFYMLTAQGGRVYMLDGLQKQYERDAPYSSFQYEGYYLEGVNARVFWQEGGKLWFGTPSGTLCRFYDRPKDPYSYNDDGRPIVAHWDTPDLDGKVFFKNKTIRHLAVRLASAPWTSVEIWAQVRGLWRSRYSSGARANYWDWGYIDFHKISFSADRTPRTLNCKARLSKVDKVRFRLKNEVLNEPFGLYNFAVEFTEAKTNYKG